MSKCLTQKFLFFILMALFLTVLCPPTYASFHKQDLRFLDGGWKKIKIPGATCGFGQSYSIYLREGNEKKISFSFAPGGACWNFATCVAPTPHTLLFVKPPTMFFSGYLQNSETASPVAGHTNVFFPYCTGDVYVGDHVASYFLHTFPIYHTGHSNITKALSYLEEKGYTDIKNADQVVIYGVSAGAIGALVHVSTIDALLSPRTDRVLISDSPGLHFGKNFFHKFTPAMRADLHKNLRNSGITFDDDQGDVAMQAQAACDHFPKWRMGFLQASSDIVMSGIFGGITPWKHRQKVYSDKGFYSIYKNDKKGKSNCHTWIIDGLYHMFLVTGITAKLTVNENSAMDFARDLVLNRSKLTSYVDYADYRSL